MKKIIIVLSVAIILTISGGYYYFTSTPTYSLYQLKKAIGTHDSATFNKYVDTDRVIDDLLTEATKEIGSELEDNPFAGLAKNFLLSMKDELKSNINKSIEEISSGKESGFSEVSIKDINQEGKSANVILVNSKNEEIRLSMVKVSDGYWKVVSVDLDDFKKLNPEALKISDESSDNDESKKLSSNAKFGEKVSIGDSWFIQVNKPEIYTPSESDLSKPEKGKVNITVSLQYFNEEDEEGDVNPKNLTLKDKENQGYKLIPWTGRTPQISDDDTVPAHDSLKGYLTYEVPEGTEIVKAVYSNSRATIVIE
jgi:hypothetical protein